MDEQQQLSVFRAQTKNVRELRHAWKRVNRQINDLLVRKDFKAVEVNTKILALIYCAHAEVVFSKLIHTPYGLALSEIEQIGEITRVNGIKFGWIKCAELAISHVEGAKRNHRPNVLQRLTTMIEEFIYDPSLIRNKLAHGQWCVALNATNTAVNNDLTTEMAAFTVVDFYRRWYSLEHLAAILEDVIESPNRAHRRDYYQRLTDLEAKQHEMSTWTLEHKIAQLRTKKSRSRITGNQFEIVRP